MTSLYLILSLGMRVYPAWPPTPAPRPVCMNHKTSLALTTASLGGNFRYSWVLSSVYNADRPNVGVQGRSSIIITAPTAWPEMIMILTKYVISQAFSDTVFYKCIDRMVGMQ